MRSGSAATTTCRIAPVRRGGSPIEGVEVVWLHGGSSRLGDDLPVELLVLLNQSCKLTDIVGLRNTPSSGKSRSLMMLQKMQYEKLLSMGMRGGSDNPGIAPGIGLIILTSGPWFWFAKVNARFTGQIINLWDCTENL